MASGESMTLLRDHAIEGLTAIFWPQELELTLSIDWRTIVLPQAAHGLTSPCSKNKLTLVRTFGHVLMFLPFCLPVYYCLLLPALRAPLALAFHIAGASHPFMAFITPPL